MIKDNSLQPQLNEPQLKRAAFENVLSIIFGSDLNHHAMLFQSFKD